MEPTSDAEDHEDVEARLALMLEAAPDAIRSSTVRRLLASEGEWQATGIDLLEGQEVSLLSHGILWIAREANMGVNSNLALWYRIGDGPIAKVGGATFSFMAERSGPLFLINHLAGQWLDEHGGFDPASVLPEGILSVAVIVWDGSVDEGLAALSGHDTTALVAAERNRLATERPVPTGWTPLWRVGRTSIFCEEITDGPPRITCRCRADAGILKYPADMPLTAETEIAWSWHVAALPSAVAEDQAITHDYLSIAVEFDNGQDLTYLWSSCLAVETSFPCPLPWWDKHETHIVVRSGTRDLNRWIEERRPILSDYGKAVGGETPARIIGVWLIALSPFQRGDGACDYADIRILDPAGDMLIGPHA
ncbi:DUF3047 domain-containing protein [Jiella pelagia]|uniref:DUF3047 domain-containing protein n=1 Tax=Jiella pelagia TaxID=2986949 RepID=A0ABY7BWF3_9HYPH|nr:DUF3047 domain-containing protein [Jiella pelagia]WAP67703.1 DUF3047 domain-containing protein [Jiella pelagia]